MHIRGFANVCHGPTFEALLHSKDRCIKFIKKYSTNKPILLLVHGTESHDLSGFISNYLIFQQASIIVPKALSNRLKERHDHTKDNSFDPY